MKIFCTYSKVTWEEAYKSYVITAVDVSFKIY